MILPTTTASFYGSTHDSGMILSSSVTPDEPYNGASIFLLQDWRKYVMLVSTMLNCLSAGMMFIFSNTIMPALGKLSDEVGIEAMVTINDVILNPLFQLIFVGGLVSVIPAVDMIFISHERHSKPARYYAAASTVVYFLGQIVITATQNIPRNNTLLALDAASQVASDYWRNDFLIKWVSWNTARTVFSTVASVFGALALHFMGKGLHK